MSNNLLLACFLRLIVRLELEVDCILFNSIKFLCRIAFVLLKFKNSSLLFELKLQSTLNDLFPNFCFVYNKVNKSCNFRSFFINK